MSVSNQENFHQKPLGGIKINLPRQLSQKFKDKPLLAEILTVLPVMIGLYFAVFAYLLRNVGITFQDNDYILTPMFNFMSRSLQQGALPLRLDTLLGGIPLYNSPQFSWEYPFYFLFTNLYNDPVQSMKGLVFVALFHFFVIYLNSYFLMRVLHLKPLPALLGASLFTFGANLGVMTAWVNILASYTWLPLIMAGAVLIIENKKGRIGLFITAFGMTLLTLAQTAQPLIHAVYLVGILYLVAGTRYLINKEFKVFFDVTKNFTFAGLLYLALASPALIPVFLGMKEMARWVGDIQPLVGDAQIPFANFSLGSYRIVDLNNTLVPFNVTHIVENSYIGIAVIFLAVLALFQAKKHWVILPLFLLSLYTLLSVTGENLGLAHLNYLLPLWNKIREPGRHLMLFALGTSVLAAFGFDYLCRTLQSGYRAILTRKHLAAFIILLLLFVLPLFSGLTYTGTIPLPLLYLVSGLGLALPLALPRLKTKKWQQQAVMFLAVLLIIASATQIYRRDAVLPLNQTSFYYPQNQNSHAILQKLAQLDDAKSYRFNFMSQKPGGFDYGWWSSNASLYGLRSFISYYQPLPYQQFTEMWWRGGDRHYYPLLGNKYYLCDVCGTFAFEKDYHLADNFNGYSLYVTDQALPHIALIGQVAGTYTTTEDFFSIVNGGFDYFNQIYAPKETASQLQNWLKNNAGPAKGSVKEEANTPTLYRMAVQSETKSLVLLNEYYSTDWVARVNGKEAQVFQVNLNQIGVLVDQGISSVEIEYRPTLYFSLLWVQVITLVLLGLFFLGWVLTKLFKVRLLPATFQPWRKPKPDAPDRPI